MATQKLLMLRPPVSRLLLCSKEKLSGEFVGVGTKRVDESVRCFGSDIGSGEGKGGGGGGTIRSAGGSIGRRSDWDRCVFHILAFEVTQEEEYFKKEQAKEIQALKKQLKAMEQGKIEYHKRQLERHLTQIKKHEELMKNDKDPKHKIHIESHKESAEAHKQYIMKLEKGNKK